MRHRGQAARNVPGADPAYEGLLVRLAQLSSGDDGLRRRREEKTVSPASYMFEGCALAWRLDGAGPPLVMIEGTGSYGTSANPLIDRLQKRYTCLSFDNRGLGASQPAGKELTVRQMARDALALMTH